MQVVEEAVQFRFRPHLPEFPLFPVPINAVLFLSFPSLNPFGAATVSHSVSDGSLLRIRIELFQFLIGLLGIIMYPCHRTTAVYAYHTNLSFFHVRP